MPHLLFSYHVSLIVTQLVYCALKNSGKIYVQNPIADALSYRVKIGALVTRPHLQHCYDLERRCCGNRFATSGSSVSFFPRSESAPWCPAAALRGEVTPLFTTSGFARLTLTRFEVTITHSDHLRVRHSKCHKYRKCTFTNVNRKRNL